MIGAKIPTVEEIKKYLETSNPLDLGGTYVRLHRARNHLIYQVEKGSRAYCLRMINPESYRRGEWMSISEEYQILKALESARLGPRVYFLERNFTPPFLIQEFIRARCFNDLKPLSENHLRAAAHAIASLNLQSPDLPFLKKYEELSYRGRGLVLYYRIFYSLFRSPRKDVWRWVRKIFPVVRDSLRILSRFESSLPSEKLWFHFDGAHCGNTYWRDEKVIFLDWQKVSLRNDPTFTLVRFATSIGAKGEVRESDFQTLVESYLEVNQIPNFARLARARLLEREVSDLVWVIWDYARRRDRRPVEEATSVKPRYEAVRELLKRS